MGRWWLLSQADKNARRADFAKVALPHLSALYTAAYYLTRDPDDAEDLVQESFLRAFRFFDKFEPGTNCKAWLLAIQHNLFINRYRKKKAARETVDSDKVDQAYESLLSQAQDDQNKDPETLFIARAMDHEIREALGTLPEVYREAIVLVDIEDLSYEQAAAVLDCAIGTIRSRVSRGRRHLQVALKDCAIRRGLTKE